MSADEDMPNNPMDLDEFPKESSNSPALTASNFVLDIGIGSGHISGSDDEDIHDTVTSKSTTPDSATISTTVSKKPATTNKHPLTKSKSSLVSYDRDSDDDEHSSTEDEMHDNEQLNDDGQSNSNSAIMSHEGAETDSIQIETNTITDQTIVTSDLMNVTPFKTSEASPTQSDMTLNYASIFPEDADIRIPPIPNKTCPPKLEQRFEEYYKSLKKTGIDQNAVIQELKDFRNPSMYEKLIAHLNIDEIGTNFPQDLYDPHWWGKESYYEELSKAQRLEMDRREKERRERTKIGFAPGVRKVEQLGIGSSSNSEIAGEKRKTRFDQ